jgi:hypothetical protein
MLFVYLAVVLFHKNFMKLHYTIIASAIIMLACNSTASTSKDNSKFDADKEQQNIMAVVEKETTGFFARDYDAWKSIRAQQAYDFQGWNNADGILLKIYLSIKDT